MKNSMVTAFVPMKENSERVKDKNTRLLCGKPACHWVLTALSRSQYVGEIIVNTDSENITDLVEGFEKVNVLKRPEYLLGDEVSIQPLIEHDINYAKNNIILQTHSTNPLLTTKTIDLAISQYIDSNKTRDSLFSVTPIQQRFYSNDGKPINHNPDRLIQTQLLEPILHENSCIYIFSKDSNMKTKNRIGSNPIIFKMDPLEAVDIDEWHDFLWADFLLKQKIEKRKD